MGETLDVRQEVLKMLFPNTAYREVSDADAKKHFGDRMQMLTVPANLPATADDVPKEMYGLIPQSHPFWLAFRKVARMTGSVAAKFALMHALRSAMELHLPKTMHDTGSTARVAGPANSSASRPRRFR
jgi:hypothetical protein